VGRRLLRRADLPIRRVARHCCVSATWVRLAKTLRLLVRRKPVTVAGCLLFSCSLQGRGVGAARASCRLRNGMLPSTLPVRRFLFTMSNSPAANTSGNASS
jgi:hypothetical protein